MAGALNATDAYFARNKGYTVPHVIWHLSAAYITHIFLNYLGGLNSEVQHCSGKVAR